MHPASSHIGIRLISLERGPIRGNNEQAGAALMAAASIQIHRENLNMYLA